MADFLLEILSEEIPARMQARARADLQRMMVEKLDSVGLAHGAVAAFSTPRRLALIVRDVADGTEAISEEMKGPRTSAPPQALDGFLRKTGLSQDQLTERDGVWFAIIDRPGRGASEVLAEAVGQIIVEFPWPKAMRWGSCDLRWVRPLHGIVALLGEGIVPVRVAGIESGAATLGHRFHHPGPITIGGAHDYVEKLRACHVIVDQAEREAIIRDGAARAAAEAGLELIADEGLVVENAGLTEWPVPLLGKFDPDFLDVPREVIVLTMRTNQKYFACAGDDGALAPAFVCVANIDASDGGAAIVDGNRKVLAARLADARFFWEQDLKVPLEKQAKRLDGIVFHEKLGTVADKVERVAKLARWLVNEGIVKGADADQAERAARLAKADLVTGMVGEFPEVQGIMGGYYAKHWGEPDAVANAVRDHYKPVGQGDEVPTDPVTVAVSLADKLDTIAAFYLFEMPPTGSKDPFALRRAAIAASVLITANNLRFSLAYALVGTMARLSGKIVGESDKAAFEAAMEAFDKAGFTLDQADQAKLHQAAANESLSNGEEIYENVIAPALNEALTFIADRLKVQQREAGVRHDLIDAVFALGSEDDLVRLLARVKALQAFVETEEGGDLLAAYKRAANILKKEEGSWASDQAGGDDVVAEEAALTKALDQAEPKATAAIADEDFTGAMAALASLRGPIDGFFDTVKVNADDPGTRARRLSLLARFRDAVDAVAAFSKIES